MVYQYYHEYVIYSLWKLGGPASLDEIFSKVEDVCSSVKTRPGKQFRLWIPKALESLVTNRELLEVTEDGRYRLSARGCHYVSVTCSQVAQFNEGELSVAAYVRAFLKQAKDVRTNKLLDKHIDLRQKIARLKKRNVELKIEIRQRPKKRKQIAPYATLPIISGSAGQQWTHSPRTPARDRWRAPQDMYPSPQSIPRYERNAEAGPSTLPATPSGRNVFPDNNAMDVEMPHIEHGPEMGLDADITALANELEECHKNVEELQVAATLEPDMDLEIREEKDALVKRIQTMTTEMNKLKETHRVGLEELEQANAILKEQVETLEMQIKENKRNHELDVEIREAAHQADLASKKKQLQEMCETIFN